MPWHTSRLAEGGLALWQVTRHWPVATLSIPILGLHLPPGHEVLRALIIRLS